EPNPWLKALQFLRMDGWEVHRVPHHAVAKKIAYRRRRIKPHELLRFFGGRRDMRCGDDLTQLGERPIRRRFFLEHIQPCAGDDPAVERASQRRFVDQLAARRIDDAKAWLDARKSRI